MAVSSLLAGLLAAAAAGAGSAQPPAAGRPFPVTIRVDLERPLGALAPIWRFFGADEPNYAYMKDGRKLLAALGELKPRSVYFRTHNLLNTGDGTPALKWGSTNAYTEDAQGRPVYDWSVVDRIFDAYLERGVRPYVEIGFMPRALSTRPDPYQHEWRPGLPYGDVAALASAEPGRVSVMAWHYHDDDVPGPGAAVELAVAGLPAAASEATLTHHRIDADHSNAYTAWKRMGSPVAPSREQYSELVAAAELALLDAPRTLRLESGTLTLRFTLPRQAVSLVTIEWR